MDEFRDRDDEFTDDQTVPDFTAPRRQPRRVQPLRREDEGRSRQQAPRRGSRAVKLLVSAVLLGTIGSAAITITAWSMPQLGRRTRQSKPAEVSSEAGRAVDDTLDEAARWKRRVKEMKRGLTEYKRDNSNSATATPTPTPTPAAKPAATPTPTPTPAGTRPCRTPPNSGGNIRYRRAC